jgi:hypothetical protein
MLFYTVCNLGYQTSYAGQTERSLSTRYGKHNAQNII